jgi:hypothetical protein
MLKNRFERSCGTFGEGKKPIVANDIGLVCPPKNTKKNLFFNFKITTTG